MLEPMNMPEIDYKARQERLWKIAEVDAVALVPGANMRYYTGYNFKLTERPILSILSPDGVSLILPEVEVPRVPTLELKPQHVFSWSDTAGFRPAFKEAIKTLGLEGLELGIDGMRMRAAEYSTLLREAPYLQIRRREQRLMAVRARKEDAEIAAIREANALSSRAFAALQPTLAAGQSERQIARRLRGLLEDEGSDGLAFAPLVQTGPHSALPHSEPSERRVQEGDALLIDFGGKKRGYCADLTRTLFLGEVDAKLQDIYEIVRAANEAAIAAIKPGVAMQEVDRAARKVIADAGYGAYFMHRTGHGLGSELHETTPQLAEGVEDGLEPRMVMTVEPGIYLPGLGGVRIEDNVLVTDTGCEVLSPLAK